MVPKTTNKIAGNTPFPQIARIKRKIDYSSTGKIVRKVHRGKLLSVNDQKNQNKLWYDILPDGVVCFYATRGSPDGPTGFLQPLLKALNEGLSDHNSTWADLLKRHHVTSVLPLKDPATGFAKKLIFAGGTRTMDVKGIVYIFDSVEENNTHNCDRLCTNLVNEANSSFKVKICFGGNSAPFRRPSLLSSLDSKFLAEDVANLAMMSYSDAISDHSFFEDKVLVSQYFQYCPNIEALFARLFGV